MISPARIMLALGLVLLPLVTQPVAAQDALSPRLQIGTSILPAVIAADKRLASAGEQ